MSHMCNIVVKKRRSTIIYDQDNNYLSFSLFQGLDSESSEDYTKVFLDHEKSDSWSFQSTPNWSMTDFYVSSPFTYGFSSLSRKDSVISASPNLHQAARPNPNVYNLKEKVGGLRRAVGVKTENIIFDTNTDGFDTHTFNNKIGYKSNVMILIITKDGHFGCFNEDVIPLAQSNSSVLASSKNLFLFAASNKSHHPPTIYHRRFKTRKSIILCPNNDLNNFFDCHASFCVGCDKKIHLKEELYDVYGVKSDSSSFEELKLQNAYCERIIAMEWI
ncbi:TLDc domain-containing protein [Entamoeba marina]